MDPKDIQRVLTSEGWQRSIADFVHLTGLTIKCVSAEGALLGKSYEERGLCRLIRSSKKGLARCRSQCGQKIARTIREGTPAIFTCYAGLLCFVSPLKVEERVLGAIFGGKILTDSPVLSKYVELAEESGLSHEALFKALGELRIGRGREIEKAMHYLNTVGQVLISHYFQEENFGQHFSQLFTLFHLGNDLNLVMDSHELYGLIMNSLSILFDLKGCALILQDPSSGHFNVRSSYGPNAWGLFSLHVNPQQGIVSKVLSDHQTVHTKDRFQIEKSGFNEHVDSVYLFPLHFGRKIEGFICIVNTRLSADDVQMIQAFCDQATLAIQNVELRQELRNRILEISRLGVLTTDLGEVRDVNTLLQLIMKRSTEIVKAEQASLMILDEATRELKIKACKGLPENTVRNLRMRVGEGIAGKVLQTGQSLLVEDIEQDRRVLQKKKMRYKTKSFISIPLVVNESPIGVLNISDKISGSIFSEDDLKIVKIFATQASIALERTQLYQRSKEMEQVLITDHLTGLLNRRYFFERTTEELNRAQRHSHPLSLMMIDVDDFKWYNDHNGHMAGDDALRSVAAVIRDTVRNIDSVARYGGEEFIVVLPQTSKEEAVIIGERLFRAVETFYFPYEENQPLGTFTISVGLATYPEDAKGIKNLIEAADKALYEAKAAGKNRMRVVGKPHRK